MPTQSSNVSGLRVIDVLETVLALVAAAFWAFCSLGVAMCSDGFTTGYCTSVTTDFTRFGYLILATLVAGLETTRCARRARRFGEHIAVIGVLLLLAMFVQGLMFFDLASTPPQ